MKRNLILLTTAMAILLICGAYIDDTEYGGPVFRGSAAEWEAKTLPPALQEQILAETAQPIRPGKPGEQPFWNEFSQGFMYAPAFDFRKIAGATSYRFTLTPKAGGEPLSFEAGVPWASLSPVWNKVPVGFVTLTVQGIANGKTIATAGTREFYRKAVFEGKVPDAVRGYRECGEFKLKNLYETSYVRYWLNHNTPDPDYRRYSYPSKMISAVLSGLARYSRINPEARETSLAICRNAADFLIEKSSPSNAAYPDFPPTYWGDFGTARGRSDIVMTLYPQNVAMAYLDLYDVTQEQRYFEAAEKIAKTYAKTQLASGTWPIMVRPVSGRIFSNNPLIPIGVVGLFDRLDTQYGKKEFRGNAKKALDWIIANPIRTFNWEGQFEDVHPGEPYKDLSRTFPTQTAVYLFKHAGENPQYAQWALECLQFSEDQFAVWSSPNPSYEPETWLVPCALEQYVWMKPINESAASLIQAWSAAYAYTGDELFKLKAMALANVMTASQMPDGELPTYWIADHRADWLNASVDSAIVMIELEESGISLPTPK